MALIDSSYFVGPINIPNTNKTEVSERLQWFIDEYEAELLEEILGYELYKEFSEGITDFDPDGSNPTIEGRWLSLLEGGEYVWNGRLKKFNGLLYEKGDTKLSLIANYVYWNWIRDQHTQTVGLGEVKATAENAENTNPAFKLIKAWNDMSKDIYALYEYLQSNQQNYNSGLSSVSVNVGTGVIAHTYQYQVDRGQAGINPDWHDPVDGDTILTDERIEGFTKDQLIVNEAGYGNKLNSEYNLVSGGGIELLAGKHFDHNVAWFITTNVATTISVSIAYYPGWDAQDKLTMLRKFSKQNFFGF